MDSSVDNLPDAAAGQGTAVDGWSTWVRVNLERSMGLVYQTSGPN